MMRIETARPALALLALFFACGGEPAASDGQAADAGGTPDAGPRPDVAPQGDELVESYSPTSPPAVRLSQKVAVLLAPSAQAVDHIAPGSVSAEIDGQPVRLFPYQADQRGNRELRFVPFPLWTPGAEVAVRVAAGLSYAGSGQTMDRALSWTFRVEDSPFHERHDAATTTALTADELARAAAGGAAFRSAEIVNDWRSPTSTLYRVSTPVDPGAADAQALAAKLRDSLDALFAAGLAAPQIGVNRRLFAAALPEREPAAYLNPVIVDWSRDAPFYFMGGLDEGCLSIAEQTALVARPRWIVVDYHQADGSAVTGERLEENAAVVFLHEYDHLNGILITDRQEQK